MTTPKVPKVDLIGLMQVGLPAWRKAEIHVQNLTTDQHQSNVQGLY